LSENIASLVCRLGPGKVGLKNPKTPPLLVTFPQENPKPKIEMLFSRN